MLYPLPEDKFKRYLEYCLKKNQREQKSPIMCDCGPVQADIYPYAYDEDNNNVYFFSICPKCGKILITSE